MTIAAQPVPGAKAARGGGAAATAARGGWGAGHSGGRYSRFVLLSKLVSATIALALLALVIAWPQLTSRDSSAPVGFSTSGHGDTESLHMVNPRYTGRDENDLPYEVSADLASQETAKSDLVALDNPKADLSMKDGSWVALTARSGVYGQKSQQLELTGEVNLFHDSGYEFNSARATIDLTNGAGEGDQPAFGHGPAGEIEGEGFRFTDKGKTIVFTGKSRLLLFPNAPDSARPKMPEIAP